MAFDTRDAPAFQVEIRHKTIQKVRAYLEPYVAVTTARVALVVRERVEHEVTTVRAYAHAEQRHHWKSSNQVLMRFGRRILRPIRLARSLLPSDSRCRPLKLRGLDRPARSEDLSVP